MIGFRSNQPSISTPRDEVFHQCDPLFGWFVGAPNDKKLHCDATVGANSLRSKILVDDNIRDEFASPFDEVIGGGDETTTTCNGMVGDCSIPSERAIDEHSRRMRRKHAQRSELETG